MEENIQKDPLEIKSEDESESRQPVVVKTLNTDKSIRYIWSKPQERSSECLAEGSGSDRYLTFPKECLRFFRQLESNNQEMYECKKCKKVLSYLKNSRTEFGWHLVGVSC